MGQRDQTGASTRRRTNRASGRFIGRRLARPLLALAGVALLAQPALAASEAGDTTGETAAPAGTETPSESALVIQVASTSPIDEPVASPPDPVPVESDPADSIVPDSAPVDSVPVDSVPVDSVPVDSVPDTGATETSVTDDNTMTPDSSVPVASAEAADDLVALAEGDVMMFEPDPVDFGWVEVGQEGEWTDVTVLFLDDSLDGEWMYMYPSDGMVVTDQNWTSCGLNACSLKVRFVPEHPGEHAPTLTFVREDNGVTVGTMRGVGAGFEPGALTAQPSTLNFGPTVIDTSSPPQTVTVRNTGSSAIDIVSSEIAGPFVVDSAAGACDPESSESLAPGDTCQVSVVFEPEEYERQTGRLDFEGDTGDFLRVYLEGYATDPSPITVSPEQQDFGTVDVGDESAAETFVVRNTSDSRVFMSGAITASGPFVVADNDCVRYYEAGDSCRFDVTFAPTEPGAATGTLDVAGYASAALSGEGTGDRIPQLAIEPETLDFGHVSLGSPTGPTTRTDTLTVRNTATFMVTLDDSEFDVTGPFSIDASDCSRQLIGNATCAVDVTFEPTTSGAAVGQVDVGFNGDVVVSASLTGSASNHAIEFNPSSIDFGETTSGSTSPSQRITLRNAGASAIAMAGALDVTSPFVLVDTNCGGVFGTGATCWADVAFAPASNGAASGQLRIHADEMVVGTAALTGTTGDGGPPTEPPADPITITPQSHDFGDVAVGESVTHRFTVHNVSADTQDVVGMGLSDPFHFGEDTCSWGLEPDTSCWIDVTFTPTETGAQQSPLTLYLNGQDSIRAALTGTGTATTPGASLSVDPASWDFGDVAVGSSASETFTIRNDGSAAATNVVISTSEPFVVDGSACTTIAANAGCEVSVTFQPTVAGAALGDLEVRSDNDLLVSASLAGDGTGGGTPALALTPTSHDFGPVFIGETSAEAGFTVEMPMDAERSDPRVTGPFAVTRHFCNAEASEDETTTICVVGVTFQPAEVGPATGTVTYTIDGVDVSASLSGEGAGGSQFTLDPTTRDFGPVPVGSTSAESIFTVSNGSRLDATFEYLDLTEPFVVSSVTCSTGIPAGDSCQIGVMFAPTDTGPATGNLRIGGEGFELSASLSGTGGSAPAADVSISPASLDFGDVAVGTTSTPSTLTIRNDGTAAATIAAVNASAPFAVVDDSACVTIAANSSCDVSVTFAPTAAGPATGSFAVSRAGFATVTASLVGSGVLPLTVSPAAIDFGSVTVGDEATATVTVTNRPGAAVPLSIGDVDSPFGVISTTCGDTLAAGASCTISLSFRPGESGSATSALTVATPSDGSIQAIDVPLSGRGAGAAVTIGAVDFGDVPVGETATATATVSNDGDAAVDIFGVTVDSPFGIADATACPATLAAGASCSVDVTFAPSSPGPALSSLTVGLNVGNAAGRVSGRGTAAGLTASSPVDFGSVLAGASRDLTVTFSNTGNVALELQPASVTGPFQVGDGCTGTLAVSATCDVVVQYAPGDGAAGQQTGTLSLPGTAPGLEATGSADLQGFAATADVSVSPLELDFGTIALDRYTPTRRTTITNDGNVEATVSASLTGQPDFDVDASDCADPLDAGASCQVRVTYQPTGAATHSGSLSIAASINLATGTHEFSGDSVAVVGTAAEVDIRADGPLEFGDVPAGQQSAPLVLTLTNDGPEVGVRHVEVPDGFDIVDDACTGTTLATAATCAISVAVSASADGVVGGDIIVTIDTDDQVGVSVSTAAAVAVSGAVTAAPGTVDFGDVVIGDQTEQQLTITNGLNVPIELTELALETPVDGGGAFGESRPSGLRSALVQATSAVGPFRLDAGDCDGRALEPGDSCTVTLVFAPATAGAANAVLSIVGSRASVEIAVSGSGAAAPPGGSTSTVPGTTVPGATTPPPGDDGTLPVTGGGSPLTTVAVAIGLIGIGAVLVTRRRRVS